MDWIEITEDDVKTLFGEYEWEAVMEAARASGSADVLTTVIARVVNRVRGYVESCDRNVLGEAGYIPGLLYDSTLVLIFEALAKTLPASRLIIDEERGKQITAAMNELKMVARCELRISPPGADQVVAPDSPVPDEGGYGGCDPVNWHGIR